MAATDLTTLTAVKQYLNNTVTTNDAELSAMISQVSAEIRTWVSRDLVPVKTYNEFKNGNDKCVMFLINYPIVSVSLVSVNGVAANPLTLPTNGGSCGFVFDDDQIELIGKVFCKGRKNVQLTYQAGFAITGEAATIPAGGPYTIAAASPYGNWNSDLGVSYGPAGAALTAVTGAPAAGQYQIAAGVYTFNVADAGKAVLLNYGYVPGDLERACIEWIADKFSQKTHIGVDSKSIAGESVKYTSTAAPVAVEALLSQYNRILPI